MTNRFEEIATEVDLKEKGFTEAQREQRREWGVTFLRSYDEGLKMARGEIARPRQGFREWLEELKREIEDGEGNADY